ncbi:MAG: NADH-quinone oxidoreductase subunit C [Thermoplasmata archaeon]|nr:NADH-quinone oxidoreductase subunit C [Thermoplasmata archaeon]
MKEKEGLGLKDVEEKLKESFPSKLESRETKRNFLWVTIDGKDIFPVCRFLKDECGFEHVSCISAVDKEENFEVVYHLSSYSNGFMIQINASVPKSNPTIESITGLWGGADYHEREAYDLMGIVFQGHPNLKRILLPEDYEGHPLRKEFKLEYREGKG